jgi:hypothetical protein
VAARDLTALSRNYFDQIHFAINRLAMLAGVFLTKMWEARKAIAMYMAEQSLLHIHFLGCNFSRPLIILFCFLAMVLLMKSVIR